MLVHAFRMISRPLALLLLTGRHSFGEWRQQIKQSVLNTPMDMYTFLMGITNHQITDQRYRPLFVITNHPITGQGY